MGFMIVTLTYTDINDIHTIASYPLSLNRDLCRAIGLFNSCFFVFSVIRFS